MLDTEYLLHDSSPYLFTKARYAAMGDCRRKLIICPTTFTAEKKVYGPFKLLVPTSPRFQTSYSTIRSETNRVLFVSSSQKV